MVDIVDGFHAHLHPSEVWSCICNYFKRRGVDGIAYIKLQPDFFQIEPLSVLMHGYPSDLAKNYLERHLYLVDPIAEMAQSSVRPFLWSDVPRKKSLSRQQRFFLRNLEEAGYREGLAFQVYGPGLANGIFGLHYPSASSLTKGQKERFQYVAQAAHIRHCELTRARQPEDTLSPRERQILFWIAGGKTNAAIAQILSLSPHTVDTLVRRLFEKLGVGDRTAAAVKGICAGLILPTSC